MKRLTFDRTSMTRATPALLALAFAVLALCAAGGARASIRPGDRGQIGRARLVAPAADARLDEGAARFAFELPQGSSRPVLVLSRQAFDPSGWTELPSGAGFTIHQVSAPVLSLADAGVNLEADAMLWWAVGVRDESTGRLRMSEVRSFTALRKFQNHVAPSPHLSPGRTGTLASAAIRAQISAAAGPPHIRLSAGYDFVPSQGQPKIPAELTRAGQPAELRPAGALEACIVQFSTPPGEAELAAITAAGGAVFSYLPDQAYLVRMTLEARARLAARSGVAWVGTFEPAYKLSPLADRSLPGIGEYMALVFPDGDLNGAGAAIAARGMEIVGQWDNGINKLLRFKATGGQLAAVAGLADVAWVEPAVKLELFNANAQWATQTNVLNNRRIWDMGIRGQGQVVNTSDSGIETTHDQFRDATVPVTGFGDYPTHRKVIAYKLGSDNPAVVFGDHAPGATYHGTHTAGTICGSDQPNGDTNTNDGMAKEAKMYFMDVSGPTLQNGVAPFNDLNDLFLPPYLGNSGGAARISSHSWGGNTGGAYTLMSFQVDQFMWAHKEFYIAFANGNAGPGGQTVGAPATAKDCASTGGSQNGGSTGIYSGSSRGPTSDGRLKPTYCAPGQGVTSSVGPGPNTYLGFTGTSMATPCGAGTVALMRQYLADGWYPTGAAVATNGFQPSAALLKAMAVNSGLETAITPYSGPDNNVGWGKINADNVLYFAGDARKLLLVDQTNGLGAGNFIEYTVNVTDGSIPLEATLVWTDPPGNPAAAIQLVNNLNLTVSKGSTVYLGNVYSGQFSVTGGAADERNVEEAVRVNNPPTGIWTVRIDAPTAPIGPQPFALVITGGVGVSAGTLALDRAEYGSTSTVQLQVTDTNAGATVSVSVASNSDALGESVTLTGSNGIYRGSVALTTVGCPGPPSSCVGDGFVRVSNGDVITATYNDAAPVATLTATARVNLDSPIITNVKAVPSGYGSVTMTWNTDRGASSRVYYGLTPSLELGSVFVPGGVTSHSVDITGLTPGATYRYDVESVSLSGSLARDNLGGAHYKVTAKSMGDILLLYGQPNFERAVAWDLALQGAGYDYDIWQGSLSTTALLGNRTVGLRAYKAVLWQPGFEQYPAVTDAQRDTITAYLDGGGRFAICAHDLGWGLSDPTSPAYSPQRQAWVVNTLKAVYQADPVTWNLARGIAGDPISGAYSAGLPYTPIRDGGAGDEVDIAPNAGGTASYTWLDGGGNATPDDVGLRWESGGNNGNASTALWGGKPSRLVDMFFEFTALDAPFNAPSAARTDVLDKTILWLLGRAKPTVAITAPNGTEVFNGGTASITWTEAAGVGRLVVARVLEYSLDGGASWLPLATGVGPSPYSWNLSGVPNTGAARVRIRITDDGDPAFSASDASNANFTINRAGGDAQGPVVVAGSIAVAPNPIVRPNPASLAARVSDLNTGAGIVAAAEWSIGAAPAAAGGGNPMTGVFTTATVDVSATLATGFFPDGVQKLWVRGRDAAGNWGPATALEVQMNGTMSTGVVEGPPQVAFLSQNAPNPFGFDTVIRYGVPARSRVTLGIYDVQGRLVRQLVSGELGPGSYRAGWNRVDQSGSRVRPGIYYYRLVAGAERFEKRMAILD